MPLKKKARADLIGTDGAKQNIAASGSASAAVDLVALTEKLHKVSVAVVVVFGGTVTADTGVEVRIRPRKNAPDEVDTLGGIVFTIPETASTEKRQSVDVPVEAWDEFDVELVNNDGSNAVDVWVSWTGAYF